MMEFDCLRSQVVTRMLLLFMCCWSVFEVAPRLLTSSSQTLTKGIHYKLFTSQKTNATSPQSPPLPLIQRQKRLNGTLYKCGFDTGRVAQLLFGDFLPTNATVVPTYDEGHETTSADILAYGGGLDFQRLQQTFRGTILYINFLSHVPGGSSTGPNAFMISSQPTSSQNVYVPCMGMALVGAPIPQHLTLTVTEPTTHPRPRNTGEHFMVYATTNCVPFRNQVALALSQVGMIHHGPCRPAQGGNFTALDDAHLGHAKVVNNYQLFSHYRYCLVLENGLYPGYITEKILFAFLGGCLPIWYGTTEVWNIFHPNAFLYVNVTDPASIQQLVQQVRYLEENRSAYEEFFQRDILANASNQDILEQYFSIDDTIGRGRLKHRIRVMMGLEDENYRPLTPNVTTIV